MRRMTISTPITTDDPKQAEARSLYFAGYRISRIAEILDIKRTTLQSWKSRDAWDDVQSATRIELTLEHRLNGLIIKNQKEGKDFKEIDLLTRQMERINSIKAKQYIKEMGDGSAKGGAANRIDAGSLEKLREAFMDQLFDYQRVWYEHRHQRIRNIIKSRQIGATYYFAREALFDACERGHDKIFLSASKAQAHQFKSYIVQLAQDAAGVELKGDPIKLKIEGAQNSETILRFLGTNSKTAQSYHGDLYIDEYFWINRFLELRKVASGMAAHKQWTQTYFSTPSAITHEAYEFWAGTLFNRGRDKKDQIEIDISHAALKAGRRCEDGQWKHIVTLEDAISQGCNLFDINQIKAEYSASDFAQLFGCAFIDDTLSAFSFVELQRCLVDSWDEWQDFKPFALRPLGQIPVAIGIDPAKSLDGCAVVVVALPTVAGGKFRILEKHLMSNQTSESQAEKIKAIMDKYHVVHISIDETGMGLGLAERMTKIYPPLIRVSYSLATKNQLAIKAKEVIEAGRLEFDAAWKDVVQAFLSVKKTLTASESHLTYKSKRTNESGHADFAWATMHALSSEPIGLISGKPVSELFFC